MISLKRNSKTKELVSATGVTSQKFRIYSPNPLAASSLAIIPSYEGEMAESGDTLEGKIEESLFRKLRLLKK